jgi:hypothetical protein
MGFDLQFESEAPFTNDDKSWIRRREGFDDMMTITLDLSTFVLATHYPGGFIPSGIALGKTTATGLYGPYDNTVGGGTADRGIFRGFLFGPIDMTTVPANNRAVSALFWRGTIKESRLPANHGFDAAAKTDIADPVAAQYADGQIPIIRVE